MRDFADLILTISSYEEDFEGSEGDDDDEEEEEEDSAAAAVPAPIADEPVAGNIYIFPFCSQPSIPNNALVAKKRKKTRLRQGSPLQK